MSPSFIADSIPPMPLPTTRASYFMRSPSGTVPGRPGTPSIRACCWWRRPGSAAQPPAPRVSEPQPSLLHLLDVQLHEAGLLDDAHELVTHLLAPGGEVFLGAGVGGHDLHDAAHGDAGDALLGGQDGAGAGSAARVHYLL